MNKTQLALFGGESVHKIQWPRWPVIGDAAIEELTQQLKNHRWAISGASDGKTLWNERFSRAFANYSGSKYCVTTSNGSGALVCSLEALDIGYGDDVIIPGLTWVADAAAVLQVNARPVLADCNPETLCMDVRTVDQVVTPRTRAIIAVHLYSALCDLPELACYAREKGFALIEDCSHVHGSKFDGLGVGNYGQCGVFSMQQTKVLTSGEGGCVLTNNETLFDRIQQSRADGRRFRPSRRGEVDLEEIGGIMGTNYCLNEISALLLYYGLQALPKQLEIKNANVQLLKKNLAGLPGITLQETHSLQSGQIYYAFVMGFDPRIWPSITSMQEALFCELNLAIERPYHPLNRNILYQPLSKKRNLISSESITLLKQSKDVDLPHAERVYETSITLPHHVFLGSSKNMHSISEALQKIYDHREELLR